MGLIKKFIPRINVGKRYLSANGITWTALDFFGIVFGGIF
jgi:hypothetical protein